LADNATQRLVVEGSINAAAKKRKTDLQPVHAPENGS
jgi:hypothetical protein